MTLSFVVQLMFISTLHSCNKYKDDYHARQLARLLLEEPDVLLLDEPTNHLDIVGRECYKHFWLTPIKARLPSLAMITNYLPKWCTAFRKFTKTTHAVILAIITCLLTCAWSGVVARAAEAPESPVKPFKVTLRSWKASEFDAWTTTGDAGWARQQFDVVINGGQVVNPSTNLNAICNVGIIGGRIAAVTTAPIRGNQVIDARGMIVAPGFVDQHSHAQNIPSNWLQAYDGVTTALEMELGAYPLDSAYKLRSANGSPLNYGYTASWAAARAEVADGQIQNGTMDSVFASLQPSSGSKYRTCFMMSADKSQEVMDLVEQQLRQGALGIGMPIGYMTKSNREEYVKAHELAKKYNVTVYTHVRSKNVSEPSGAVEGFLEPIGASAATGARSVISHINSSATQAIDKVIQLIKTAQKTGVPIYTEAYPWGAGSTIVSAAFLKPSNLEFLHIWPENIQITADYPDLNLKPGGRLLSGDEGMLQLETLRSKYGDSIVIVHYFDENQANEKALLDKANLFPNTIIGSDAMPITEADGSTYTDTAWPIPSNAGITHPRSVATYSKFFYDYVVGGQDGTKQISLMEAVRNSSTLPADLLAKNDPSFLRKGRIQVGADADVIVFDLNNFKPQADYTNTLLPSSGMQNVLVNGQFVIIGTRLVTDARPGLGVRSNSMQSTDALKITTTLLASPTNEFNRIYSTNATETASLIAQGWTQKTASFSFLDPAAAAQDNRLALVYRYDNATVGSTAYSTNKADKSLLDDGYVLNTSVAIDQKSGAVGAIADLNNMGLGTVGVATFYNPKTRAYFCTTSQEERKMINGPYSYLDKSGNVVQTVGGAAFRDAKKDEYGNPVFQPADWTYKGLLGWD